MHRWTIAYTVIAIWTFGWLAGRFGILPSLFAAIIFFIPAVFAWRMFTCSRTIKRHEYGYLGLVTVLALCATAFIVSKWYESGMDRLAMFDREYQQFRNRVASMREYKNVEVSYTHRKGGRVYLDGYVANKGNHDRLLEMIEWMVRNNDSGYYDGVDYPGKSDATEANRATSNRGEQNAEPELPITGFQNDARSRQPG